MSSLLQDQSREQRGNWVALLVSMAGDHRHTAVGTQRRSIRLSTLTFLNLLLQGDHSESVPCPPYHHPLLSHTTRCGLGWVGYYASWLGLLFGTFISS